MTGELLREMRETRAAVAGMAELTGKVMAQSQANAMLLEDTRSDLAIVRRHLEGNGRPGLLERVAVLERAQSDTLPPPAKRLQARWQLVAGLIATILTAIGTALASWAGLD